MPGFSKWWVLAAVVILILSMHVCSEMGHTRRMKQSLARANAHKTVFVLIPVLYDVEDAAETLDSLFEQAAVPQRISVGVIQHASDGDTLNAYTALARHPHTAQVQVARYPPEWAEGAPAARALSMRLLKPNSDFVLWVDAHTTFTRDWDEALIEELLTLPEKSILTTLPPQTGTRTTSTFVRAVPEEDAVVRLEAAPTTKRPNTTLPSPFFCAAFCFAQNVPQLPVQPYTNNLCLLHSAYLIDRGFRFYTPQVCPVTQDWRKSRPGSEPSAEFTAHIVEQLEDPESVAVRMGVDVATGTVIRKGVQQGLSADPSREELVCKLGGSVALGFIDS